MLSISIISGHQSNHANNFTKNQVLCLLQMHKVRIPTVNVDTYDMCIQSFYWHVARVTHCHVLHSQYIQGFLCCASRLCLRYIHTHIIGDLAANPLVLMLLKLEVCCMYCNHVDYLLPFVQLSYCIPNRNLYSLSNHFILLSWNRCAYLHNMMQLLCTAPQ